MHYLFKSYSNFTEGLDITYWWSCIVRVCACSPAHHFLEIFFGGVLGSVLVNQPTMYSGGGSVAGGGSVTVAVSVGDL